MRKSECKGYGIFVGWCGRQWSLNFSWCLPKLLMRKDRKVNIYIPFPAPLWLRVTLRALSSPYFWADLHTDCIPMTSERREKSTACTYGSAMSLWVWVCTEFSNMPGLKSDVDQWDVPAHWALAAVYSLYHS